MDAGSFYLSCGDRKQSPDPLAVEDEISRTLGSSIFNDPFGRCCKRGFELISKSRSSYCERSGEKSFETAIELPESSPEIWLEVVSSSYEMTGTELTRKFPAAPSRGFRKALKYLQSRNDRQLSFL